MVIRNSVDVKWQLDTFEYSANMVASKGEPIFAHGNMHGLRWKFMAPSSSRARNSAMKSAERSSLKILPSPTTSTNPEWFGWNQLVLNQDKTQQTGDSVYQFSTSWLIVVKIRSNVFNIFKIKFSSKHINCYSCTSCLDYQDTFIDL